MMDFKLSRFADSDIYDILDYTVEKWDFAQALEYKNELFNGIIKLQSDPHLMMSKSRDDLVTGCRSYQVHHHYIFYRINDAEQTIEIVRILHEAMNFELPIRENYFPR